jgi:hypothetical protein
MVIYCVMQVMGLDGCLIILHSGLVKYISMGIAGFFIFLRGFECPRSSPLSRKKTYKYVFKKVF